MVRRERKPLDPVCGRLAQAKDFGQTDFCGLPHGHEGEHVGKYNRMRWRDNPAGRGKKPIIMPHPDHQIPAGGNIRGN